MSSKMEGRISFRFARPIRRITDALLRVVEDGPQLQGKILFESVGCQPHDCIKIIKNLPTEPTNLLFLSLFEGCPLRRRRHPNVIFEVPIVCPATGDEKEFESLRRSPAELKTDDEALANPTERW